MTAESLAAITLIGCSAPALMGFPAHPGLFVSAALAFSSYRQHTVCKINAEARLRYLVAIHLCEFCLPRSTNKQ